MPAEICAVIDELVQVLAQYSQRLDRDVEMVVETDGACSIRVADTAAAESFGEVVRFEDFAALMQFLETGEL